MMDDGKNKPAESPGAEKTDEEPRPRHVRFDYIKGQFFRVIHADGVVGGLTPRLDVHMDFWSERFPIPKQVVHALKEDGSLGEEVKAERQTRDAIVREVEAGVVLDVETARALRDWLNERIAEADKLLTERRQESKDKP